MTLTQSARVPTPTGIEVALLHVDDSPADRYRRRRVLETAGFRVLEEETGAAARARFAGERPDLVLIDVRLPDTTGFDLARELRASASAADRDIGVVLISSYFTESEFRVQGLDSGADAYLIEPITDAELVATMRAVLRRVEQLKAARANERLLDALFIRRVSRFGTALLGRSRDSLEGIPAPEHPGRWAIFKEDGVTPARPEDLPLTRAVTTGAIITDEEWILRRADGGLVRILCNAGPIRDAEGQVTGGVIAWHDVTARREVEDELRRRTRELQLADQTKNDFLATVVHEVRQPIQAALAALALMKARRDRRTGERARDVVERQLLAIARIVEDLLDATRILRGDVALRAAPLDLGQVVRQASSTCLHARVIVPAGSGSDSRSCGRWWRRTAAPCRRPALVPITEASSR